MKVLLIGDIVGKPGREAVKRIVPEFCKSRAVDLVVANAENIAGGSGLTYSTADEVLASHVDLLTSGDHIWKKKEIYERLENDKRILRPANYPDSCPGKGHSIVKTGSGKAVGVINVLGRVFMRDVDSCPFKTARNIIDKMSKETKIILVDIHAEATSEKIALGRFLDGLVSVVFGTHTHVQTSDERILPGGTAYITDIGMTGPLDSVIGRDKEAVIKHFLTCMPTKFEVADKDVELHGAIVDIDEETGKAVSIERVREKAEKYI